MHRHRSIFQGASGSRLRRHRQGKACVLLYTSLSAYIWGRLEHTNQVACHIYGGGCRSGLEDLAHLWSVSTYGSAKNPNWRVRIKEASSASGLDMMGRVARSRTQITGSKSRRMLKTNMRNILNLFILPPFVYPRAPEARLIAVKARLAHPTLHRQSYLTYMATQDPKKQNL